MYKDKDKQRATTRERVRRYRAKLKGVTYKPERNAVTPNGNAQDVTPDVEPEQLTGSTLAFAENQCAKNRARMARESERFAGPLTKERQTSRKGFND